MIFFVLAALLAVPYIPAIKQMTTSGTLTYAKTWEANDFAYRLFDSLARKINNKFDTGLDSRITARGIIALLIFAFAIWQGYRSKTATLPGLFAGIGYVILVMLLLSPTLYPWYYVPLIAVAAIAPRPSFLIWTLLLPLTRLTDVGHNRILLLACIHLPAWLMLVVDLIRDNFTQSVQSVTDE
jgi:hypothetical protein